LSGTTWMSRHQKGKTRKVKPIWIYWSKRQWVAVASPRTCVWVKQTQTIKSKNIATQDNKIYTKTKARFSCIVRLNKSCLFLHLEVHMCNYLKNCYYNYNRFTALWILSGTTWVSQYQKKHSPTHTYRGHQSSFICFLHLLKSTASSPTNIICYTII